MLFKHLAQTFNSVENASSRLEMTSIISQIFEKASSDEISQIVYLFQGNLGPAFQELDFGLGEKLVIQSLSKISGFSEKDINTEYSKKGDLGLVTEELVSKKKQKSLFVENLTVEKVFSNFLKLAKVSGTGSQELKKKLLAELINSAQKLEARYIVRMPLQTLRLGIGDPTLMDALSLNYLKQFRLKEKTLEENFKKKFKKEEDISRQMRMKLREKIETVYNVHPDLGFIASELKQHGLKALQKISITPGIPIRPTLAERLTTPKEIVEKIGKCFIEWKYDGFRLQVHVDNDDVKIFSRKQENMTSMFPDLVKAVKQHFKAKKAIFEGEALAIDSTGKFLPFQVTIQRKRKYDIDEMVKKLPLKFFAFDILFLNGKNLMNLNFKERRKILSDSIKKNETVSLTKGIETDKPEEIESFFTESLELGLEGIIAKDLNAEYVVGARKFSWIKLKKSYKNESFDTVDLVIIGFFSGKGARSKFGLGGLLVASYNKENDLFESIAKIGTGFSEEQLAEFFKKLSKKTLDKKHPRILSELKPDYWVSPEFVIEIAFDEITKSPTHMSAKNLIGSGLALRFPRLIQERPDRLPEDATTSEEIVEMFNKQKSV